MPFRTMCVGARGLMASVAEHRESKKGLGTQTRTLQAHEMHSATVTRRHVTNNTNAAAAAAAVTATAIAVDAASDTATAAAAAITLSQLGHA